MDKVDDIKTKLSSREKQPLLNWIQIALVFPVLINYLFFFFSNSYLRYVFYNYIPLGMGFLTHSFLANILNEIRNLFSTINVAFQKQVDANSVDLSKIFPFTNPEKLKKFKKAETAFTIRQTEQLASIYYELVTIVVQINDLFNVTTMVSLVMWFGFVMDASYDFVYFLVNKEEPEPLLEFWYMEAHFVFFVLWFFAFMRMFSDTQKMV